MRRNTMETRDEQEHKLWEASQNFMKGEIDIQTLEQIERPYARDFRKALLATAKKTIGKPSFDKRQGWDDERERELWRASHMYIKGTIMVQQLEQTEMAYTRVFKSALIILARRNIFWRLLDLLFLQRRTHVV